MKKLLGIFMIVLGVLLGMSVLAGLPSTVKSIIAAGSGAYNLGYMIGNLIVLAAVSTGAFFLIKYGMRKLKSQPKRAEANNHLQ